ncbi:MAG: regulatory protein RecX [Sulfurifustaceae bacterium]
MIAWLARREHSRSEVAVKLERKGCAPEVAAQVVSALAAQGLLSDERFAEALVRNRRRRGYGPVRIRKELADKGLAAEEVDRFVALSGDEWIDEIEQVRRRKFGEALPRSYEERARQARFLQYRGFTFDQIQRALRWRDD